MICIFHNYSFRCMRCYKMMANLVVINQQRDWSRFYQFFEATQYTIRNKISPKKHWFMRKIKKEKRCKKEMILKRVNKKKESAKKYQKQAAFFFVPVLWERLTWMDLLFLSHLILTLFFFFEIITSLKSQKKKRLLSSHPHFYRSKELKKNSQ